MSNDKIVANVKDVLGTATYHIKSMVSTGDMDKVGLVLENLEMALVQMSLLSRKRTPSHFIPGYGLNLKNCMDIIDGVISDINPLRRESDPELAERLTIEIMRVVSDVKVATGWATRKAYIPEVRDPNGFQHGRVQSQGTYQNVGSQTPIAHDRDGKPIEVEGGGMMNIPGYEWHDKSKEFHRMAKRIAAKFSKV